MTPATFNFRLATCSPRTFEAWAGRAAPWFGMAALGFIATGLAGALLTPAGAWQGDTHRILAVQLPAMGVAVAIFAAIAALSVLVLRENRVAATLASALAPTGMVFTVLALWSGALWEKPQRGTWWGWEPQSVCMLLLLFLYGGIVALKAMHEDPHRGERAGALISLVGAANLPVLCFSIHWWDVARHGPAATLTAPGATPAMLATLALVAVGFVSYAAFIALQRARLLIAQADWQAGAAQNPKEYHR